MRDYPTNRISSPTILRQTVMIRQGPRKTKSIWRMAGLILVKMTIPDPPDYIVFIYNSLTDFPVCRIIFGVCQIVLLARITFDGLAQKSWQKHKNLNNFHKNDFSEKSPWQIRENCISKLLSGRFYFRSIFLGAKLK